MAGHWNYRVTVETAGGERLYAIREVYHLDGAGVGWTDPVPVEGDSVEEIRWVVARITEALEKPVLDLGERAEAAS